MRGLRRAGEGATPGWAPSWPGLRWQPARPSPRAEDCLESVPGGLTTRPGLRGSGVPSAGVGAGRALQGGPLPTRSPSPPRGRVGRMGIHKPWRLQGRKRNLLAGCPEGLGWAAPRGPATPRLSQGAQPRARHGGGGQSGGQEAAVPSPRPSVTAPPAGSGEALPGPPAVLRTPRLPLGRDGKEMKQYFTGAPGCWNHLVTETL
ncbi:Hypothetical predicted protein [Marmota monax]|uniref:Uncharacterized protein n=1 Tax=Marmota monax TaxID=9995 RepID=A0A5E4BY99_MARMO|nr:Hypothetical predicted protein [Marmota monax]